MSLFIKLIALAYLYHVMFRGNVIQRIDSALIGCALSWNIKLKNNNIVVEYGLSSYSLNKTSGKII